MRQFTLSRKLQVTLDPALVQWTPPGTSATATTRALRDRQVSSISSSSS